MGVKVIPSKPKVKVKEVLRENDRNRYAIRLQQDSGVTWEVFLADHVHEDIRLFSAWIRNMIADTQLKS